MQSDENAYPECKSMWQKKDGNQTVTPFLLHLFFGKQPNYVYSQINIGVKSVI